MESFLTTLASRPWFRSAVPVILIIAVIAAYWEPLHLDLWNDEVYSLIRFQQVPLRTTLTDYHETNNHILFNVLLNVYLKAIGSPSTRTVLEHPELLRLVPMIFTLGTHLLLYSWMRRMLGLWPAVLACILLTATLPYFNFALQYRAYSLVMLLGTAWLYAFWQYMQYARNRGLIILFLSSAAICYAHPAGFYLVAALSAATALAFLTSILKHNRQRQRALYASSITALGAAAAILAYLPVMRQLLANPWVAQYRIGALPFLKDKLLSSSLQLLCSRYWLVLLAIPGLFLSIRAAKGGNKAAMQQLRWMLFCVLVYALTFLIPMLRRDDAPQRTFTMLIPVLVAGLVPALDALARRTAAGKFHLTILALICIALLAEMPSRLFARNRRADELAQLGRDNASLIDGYYLHHFRPMHIAKLAARRSSESGLPVYCGFAYRQEMPHYLEAVGLPWREYRTPEQRASAPDSCYIVTSFPEQFIRQYAGELRCYWIEPSPSFYHLLLAVRRQ